MPSATAQQIQAAVDLYIAENEKFLGGNKSAGTRARKALMEIKKACDARRKEIQSAKNETSEAA